MAHNAHNREAGLDETPEDAKVTTYKQLFCNFADRTSMQGVGNVKNSKHIVARIFWSVLLIAAIFSLSFHLWYSLQQYYMYPKTAKINLGFANLPFPEVTICNVNAVSKRRLDTYRSPRADDLKRLVNALKPATLVKETLNVSLDISNVVEVYATESEDSSSDYFEGFWSDFSPEQFYDNYDSTSGHYSTPETPDSERILTATVIEEKEEEIDDQENEDSETGNSEVEPAYSGDDNNELYDVEMDIFNGNGSYVDAGIQNGTTNGVNEKTNDMIVEVNAFNENDSYSGIENTITSNDTGSESNGTHVDYTDLANSDFYSDSGAGSADIAVNGNNETFSGDGETPEIKKRRKRFANFLKKFNFTKFDPTFNDWFKEYESDKSTDEYSGKIDATTKLDALFRRTLMKLARWERGRLGHNITRMLVKCTFAGRTCDSRNLFRLHQTPEYGNCWTLSSRKFISRDSGPNAGLSLVLNLQTMDYLEGFTHGYGARIQIHNRGAYPDPYQDGVSLPAAMETNIGLKLVTFERLSGKYGDCDNGETFMQRYKRPYSRRTCQIFCYANHVIDSCGCYDDYTEEVAVKTGRGMGLKSCDTKEEYECVHHLEKAFERKEITCPCRNPCKESAYTKSISSHQWPTEGHAQLLMAGVCKDDPGACKAFLDSNQSISSLQNNFLKLNIYFEDLNYEEIGEEPDIGVAQILSDIGGAIGLWIGLSVVSFCEVLQLALEILELTRYKMCHAGERDDKDAEKVEKDENIQNSYANGHSA